LLPIYFNKLSPLWNPSQECTSSSQYILELFRKVKAKLLNVPKLTVM